MLRRLVQRRYVLFRALVPALAGAALGSLAAGSVGAASWRYACLDCASDVGEPAHLISSFDRPQHALHWSANYAPASDPEAGWVLETRHARAGDREDEARGGAAQRTSDDLTLERPEEAAGTAWVRTDSADRGSEGAVRRIPGAGAPGPAGDAGLAAGNPFHGGGSFAGDAGTSDADPLVRRLLGPGVRAGFAPGGDVFEGVPAPTGGAGDGPAGVAPEPGAWMVFALGLTCVGFGLLRRRGQPALASGPRWAREPGRRSSPPAP